MTCHRATTAKHLKVPKLGYEFLTHTTDAYIQATGSTMEEAFENAAKSLFDTMCNLESVTPQITEEVNTDGGDEVRLLYNWLETLLLKFELECKVYCKFKIVSIKREPDGIHIMAQISGEPYDRRKHGAKVEVKAVTFHKMEVQRAGSLVTLRFILDL
jgi:SHS2 domain-containing protein